jgi:hypothetical protein
MVHISKGVHPVMPDRAKYLALIQTAFAAQKEGIEQIVARCSTRLDLSNVLIGYIAPGEPLQYAALSAFLYERTGERRLAQEALRGLLVYSEWAERVAVEAKKQRPEYGEAVPPVDYVFAPLYFVPTAERIRQVATAQEWRTLGQMMADSLRQARFFPEWGTHNRALLRAASLALAARAFPEHPDAAGWADLADELAEESWGHWSIEDTMLYQPHWLRAMILYAEARGRSEELADLLQPRLHLKAQAQMMTPLGILTDYGDSHWVNDSQWEWLACLEWGAAQYRDPALKWAAAQIWRARQVEGPTLRGAQVLTLAWRWCDDTVPVRPPFRTPDALDDVVSKKIVYRTGWGEDDSFALQTYRDEGDYGLISREYLRTTLAVTAEKMHHGHADEGSLAMLVHKGSILLHESGYREAPPDGIYRSDVYHNRLIWRPGRRPATSPHFVDWARGDGYYRSVRAERLYQTHLGDAEFTRVRVTEEARGVAWDRSIFFLPAFPCWLVIDTALPLRTETRTLSDLWWTTDILRRGATWFDTRISHIQTWQNPGDARLLVATLVPSGQPCALTVEPARRAFQDEQAIVHTWYGEHRPGKPITFVTVLWPHAPQEDAAERAAAFSLVPAEPDGRGTAVRFAWQGEERILATLNDLTAGYLPEDIRPRYNARQGLTRYGALASDAHVVYARQSGKDLWAGFVNGTALAHGQRTLYAAPETSMFQEDATNLSGVPARFRWEGEATLE